MFYVPNLEGTLLKKRQRKTSNIHRSFLSQRYNLHIYYKNSAFICPYSIHRSPSLDKIYVYTEKTGFTLNYYIMCFFTPQLLVGIPSIVSGIRPLDKLLRSSSSSSSSGSIEFSGSSPFFRLTFLFFTLGVLSEYS